MRLRTFISWLINSIALFSTGVLFTLPWIFTNEEILNNFETFWGLK
jgi:uncharacterized membrane protein YidH (DUF202 family)